MEIYEQLTNEEIDKAILGDIKDLWKVVSSLSGDDEFMNLKIMIKNGLKLMFNIEFVVRGYYEEYPDTHYVKIKGYRKCNLDEFWDEIREREKIAKDILRGMYNTGDQEEIDIDGHD